MRSQPKDSGNLQRIVAGAVNNVGSSTAMNWAASKLGTGQYRIRFTPPFVAIPAITAIQNQGGGAFVLAAITGAPDYFDIYAYSAAGALTDIYWNFEAVGR